jgi:hypothetical protein
MFFRLRRVASSNQEQMSPEEYTSKALEKLIVGERADKAGPPALQLRSSSLLLSQGSTTPLQLSPEIMGLTMTTHVQHRTQYLHNTFSAVPKSRIPDLFTLYTYDELDLVVFYDMTDEQNIGHCGCQFVTRLQLGVQQAPLQPSADKSRQLGRALFAQTEREKAALLACLIQNRHVREENPVRVVVAEARETAQDGRVPRVVPMEIRLYNASWNRNVQCTLELLPAAERQHSEKDTHSLTSASTSMTTASISHTPLTDFQWLDATTLQATLAPHQSTKLCTRMLVLQPGVFDLSQRWKLTTRVESALVAEGETDHSSRSAAALSFVQKPAAPEGFFVEVN